MNISIRNECNSRNEEIKQKKTKKENKLGTQQLMCNITADRSLTSLAVIPSLSRGKATMQKTVIPTLTRGTLT